MELHMSAEYPSINLCPEMDELLKLLSDDVKRCPEMQIN
jgi:hypothetical protein